MVFGIHLSLWWILINIWLIDVMNICDVIFNWTTHSFKISSIFAPTLTSLTIYFVFFITARYGAWFICCYYDPNLLSGCTNFAGSYKCFYLFWIACYIFCFMTLSVMTVFSLLTCQALTKFAVLLTFKLNIQLIEVHTWNNLLSSKI